MRLQVRFNNQKLNMNIGDRRSQLNMATNKNIAKLYVKAIREGSIKLEDVPVSLKRAVQKQLDSI
jgi:hypothetical protein